MPFYIVRNDIVQMQVDAIVNTANPEPLVGAGVDFRIHQCAGEKLLKDRRKIGKIAVGEAVITPGYRLPCHYVIHTVGPIWEGGHSGEAERLRECYRSSLYLAKKKKCKSVAFPLISSGTYGFPKGLALEIAIGSFSDFLKEDDMEIYLVVYDRESFSLSAEVYRAVSEYINETYIEECRRNEIAFFEKCAHTVPRERSCAAETPPPPMPRPLLSSAYAPPSSKQDLQEKLRRADCGFSERLLQLIDETGKKDSDIYKKANVDRKLFSKIRTNSAYQPRKTTAVALAMALELDLAQTNDLLKRAGYILSHSSKFDIIVEYFILQKNFDLLELNAVLFEFDQPLLNE